MPDTKTVFSSDTPSSGRRNGPAVSGPGPVDAGVDDPPRAAPAQHQQPGALDLVDLEERDVLGDPGHLGRPEADHLLVVLGVVGDVARPVLLLDATDAVHETGGAGNGPGSGQRVGIPQVGPELLAVVLLGGERDPEIGVVGAVGDPPRLSEVDQGAGGV